MRTGRTYLPHSQNGTIIKIHYGIHGERRYRPACGQGLLTTLQYTLDLSLVTCERCKGTLKYRTRWYPGTFDSRERQ